MENGHVKIHDPFTNHKNLSTTSSTSDSDGMEDTPEFRLLMAYAQRRRRDTPADEGQIELEAQGLPANGSPQAPGKAKEERKKKRKKGWKRLSKILSCISPRSEPKGESPADGMCRTGDFRGGRDSTEDEKLEEAANRLTEIADAIPFTPPEVETDSADDVEKVIGLLLRDVGDGLTERGDLRRAMVDILWNYGFFERLMTTLLTRMGILPSNPENPEPQTSSRRQIAVTCEVASRLSAADTLPSNRLLGLGARYLQEHHTTWAQQQGGYEEAFYSEDEDDIQ
ncbi:apoptosis facilitator Bcl-2-like protein 14 [Notolabrus celidotus]|uniref:apoptosis facilitator Bcl-2-like protein 14 n=1 Tax=Notolabrus celidotus TaxID=1203425 RepID=UPI00148FC426|nr:apoptosis facilitator Bcl-2-like protein 14 [Notolabrus celidotus]